ncbi:MAG: hypothetical protein AAF346_23265, partial [Pseudomonadota bacterium]
ATLLSIGYAAVAMFSLHMSAEAPNPVLADRAFWLGITFLIAAGLALPISWLVADLSNIWCIPPRRSRLDRISHDRNPGPPQD